MHYQLLYYTYTLRIFINLQYIYILLDKYGNNAIALYTKFIIRVMCILLYTIPIILYIYIRVL